jgi:hypothetical protein
MNKLIYIVFLIVFFIPILKKLFGLPNAVTLLFELASGLVFLIALVYGAYHKTFSISFKYLLLFFFVCAHFLVGAIINAMDMFPIIAGIRNYLKYMPLFLLPLVYRFTDGEIKGQFRFLIALGLLQFPLIVIERFVLDWHVDIVAGTLGIGSIVSMYLVCCVVILTGFYFRERLSSVKFLILAFLLFIPTTLNETKGTIILMLVGLIVVMLGTSLKKSHIVMATSATAVMLAMFIIIYNQSYSVAGKEGLLHFFTDFESGIGHYLYSGDTVEGDVAQALEPDSPVIGALPTLDPEQFKARRIDAIILPLEILSDDPVKLMVGTGIGNTMTSTMHGFAGKYSFLGEYSINKTAVASILWEIGVIGLFLYLIFMYFIYRDARQLSKADSISAAFALGWTGVVAIIILSLPYKNIIIFDAPSALFWYFSGYVAAERFRFEQGYYTKEQFRKDEIHASKLGDKGANKRLHA